MRLIVLLPLVLSQLHFASTVDTNWVSGFILNNAEQFGLPGFLTGLSSKSAVLTKLLHWAAGNKLEEAFKELIGRSVQNIADTAEIENVESDNSEELTFMNGKISGLRSIRMVPNTEINIVWSKAGIPMATAAVQFSDLKITGDIKTYFRSLMKTVEGKAEIKVAQNNDFLVKFYIYPGAFSGCWLKLYDVTCTNLNELTWSIKGKDGVEDSVAAMAMQGYFTATENKAEIHIKSTIANVIYSQLPTASPWICHNEAPLVYSKKQEVMDTDDALSELRAIKVD